MAGVEDFEVGIIIIGDTLAFVVVVVVVVVVLRGV